MRVSTFALALVLGCASVGACSAGTGKDSDPTLTAPVDSGGGLDLDGGGGGFDASDPDTPYDPDAACAARSFGGAKIPLAIAIVFDVSGSMKDEGRMTTAKAGLKKALTDPKFDDVAVALFRFGLQNLNTFPPNGCITDKTPFFAPEPLSTGRAALFAKIDSLVAAGATPTYSGLNDAYAWLAPNVKAKTPPMDGKTAVILVTDGAPNCGSETVEDFVALVKKGRAATMDTFIIGLPGSGTNLDDGTHSSVLLTRMAAAGTELGNLPAGCEANPTATGSAVTKPCYFDLQKDGLSADTLSTALDVIRKAASSCEYGLPVDSAKFDVTAPGVVVVDSAGKATQIPYCVDPAAPPATGCWVWADDAKTRVKILGAACQTVKTDDGSRVDILLQCRAQ